MTRPNKTEGAEGGTATPEKPPTNGPRSLSSALDAILEKALPLGAAAFGAILAYDGQLIRGVAFRGAPEAVQQLLRQPRPPSPLTTGRLLRGERFVQIADVVQLVRSEENGALEAFIDFSGARAMLYLPLRGDGRFLGVMAAYRRQVSRFTEEEIALLEGCAREAAAALQEAA